MSRQLGSMIADLTGPNNPDAKAAADLAVSLAPGDPVTRWLAASAETNGTAENRLESAAKLLEDAVRLSPFDYRWRVELGRAYEQADKPASAEIEFKRAVELAPTYAYSRWHLGNFYLRQDRVNEAFAELRKAADSNRTYREQAFSLAWDYFDKDPEKVEQIAADTSDARASLALFFAARGRASESLRIWNLLSETEKAANPQVAKDIAQGLFIQRIFPQALEFARQLGIDADARLNAVTNPGFERVIGAEEDSRFDWRINRSDSKIDITTDSSVRHTGSRSLKLSFRTYLKPELYNVFQTVVVEPNKNYHLSFWARTESLKSSGGPFIQVVNANDDKPITASKAFQTGTNDWQEYSVDFRTPENCNGITFRTVRQPCGDQCPIVGTLWYDDFELTTR
ncbi:MAG: carbohydrate binding domain-containing protein [Chloracidobacterium sp.]|nr:carbohydrate binding domain-containing protein [Chloracidobacterium sp.]